MTDKYNNTKLTKSKERIQQHGEVFTPTWMVEDMLNLLPSDVWHVKKTVRFLEPSCGEGAFLMEIYKRKLQALCNAIEKSNRNVTQEQWEWAAALQTSNIYGIELLQDNAIVCRKNLLKIFILFYKNNFPNTQNKEVIEAIKFLIRKNIVQGNSLTYRKCTVECGNECTKCDPIVFSEWTPIVENYMLKRKEYSYYEIVNANKQRQNAIGGLFEKEFINEEYGLLKEYKPVNWKEIKNYA
jgi:hypothetical protein